MPEFVDIDGVDNAATSAAGLLTRGVTLSGYNPGDTLEFSLPSGQTHVAWSPYTSLERWKNNFKVIRDGDPNNIASFGEPIATFHATAEEARLAFNAKPAVERQLSGASSYTFGILDDPVSDNRGGLSIQADLTAASVAQGIARTANAVFFRMDTATPLRLWCGINDVPIGIDSVDDAGSVYLGAGRLLNVPDLEVLINGVADRVEFYLPGVSVENSNRVAAGAPDIQGTPVHVGIATLDDRYQPLTAITPVWYGLADLWAMKQPKSHDPSAPPTRTLVLSVGSGRTGRARARRAAYTDAQQKLLYPTDRFCDRTARYTQLYDVEWPIF